MALSPEQASLMRGHPTAPGVRDSDPAARTRQGRQEDVRDGKPGVPRVRPTPASQGPGIPGPTPSGPTQPGTVNDGDSITPRQTVHDDRLLRLFGLRTQTPSQGDKPAQ